MTTSSSSDRSRRREIRARMAETGESYTTAARALGDAGPGIAVAVIGPAPAVRYPDETDVTVDELGRRALPDDATAAQHARAEALWRPVHPGRPCRCTGPCEHGYTCTAVLDDQHDGRHDRCDGKIAHVDRYPGSFFSITVWEDVYQCQRCEATSFLTVTLPDVPWAQVTPNPVAPGGSITSIFEGVRHPSFPDDDADLLFEYDDDEPEDVGCPECGAGGTDNPYGECVCEPQ